MEKYRGRFELLDSGIEVRKARAMAASSSNSLILLVEDNEDLGGQVVAQLKARGHDVVWQRDGRSASCEQATHYDLVILDLRLPDADGLDLLKLFRRSADTPILILSARSATRDRVRGIELGADDYLTKPFWPEELMARVEARLRRPVLARGDTFRFGPLHICFSARTVHVNDAPIPLTAAEFSFLATLASRPGAAVTRRSLVEAVLDPEREGTERTLDTHASRLRHKLGPSGSAIQTVWGIGYRLHIEPG